MDKKVGILAIQGSFAEHGTMLHSMGIDFVWVKDREPLETVTHLIIPGGESTTMRKLLGDFDMYENLASRIKSLELKVFGTCAGAIILSDFMNIEVERNAYGAQQESFVGEISPQPPLSKKEGEVMQGVFIRAPKITKIGQEIEVLAHYRPYDSHHTIPVLVQQHNLLAATFHPELIGEKRIYEYFLKM